MIEPAFVRTMARYNAWQNKQLTRAVEAMPVDELTKDRGAFFGSIFATLNHLLWGDTIWMSRFDPAHVKPPAIPAQQHCDMTPTIGVWSAERFAMDGRISDWARRLHSIDLRGDLKWYSGMNKTDMAQPLAQCVVHFFNHQTHHRGQVHAMLTAAGATAPVSDLAFMSEDD